MEEHEYYDDERCVRVNYPIMISQAEWDHINYILGYPAPTFDEAYRCQQDGGDVEDLMTDRMVFVQHWTQYAIEVMVRDLSADQRERMADTEGEVP